MMVMVMLVFILIFVIVMVMMLVLLFLLLMHEFLEDLRLQIGSAFDRGKNLFAVELCKRSRDDRCLRIVFVKDLYALSDLLLTCLVGPCENDRAGALDLVDEEFAEVFHIKLALGSIHNRYSSIECHICAFGCILHCLHYIRELSDSGGLDQDPVRGILIHHFPERCSEITYQ